jgi:hypothetical protein
VVGCDLAPLPPELVLLAPLLLLLSLLVGSEGVAMPAAAAYGLPQIGSSPAAVVAVLAGKLDTINVRRDCRNCRSTAMLSDTAALVAAAAASCCSGTGCSTAARKLAVAVGEAAASNSTCSASMR